METTDLGAKVYGQRWLESFGTLIWELQFTKLMTWKSDATDLGAKVYCQIDHLGDGNHWFRNESVLRNWGFKRRRPLILEYNITILITRERDVTDLEVNHITKWMACEMETTDLGSNGIAKWTNERWIHILERKFILSHYDFGVIPSDLGANAYHCLNLEILTHGF